MNSNLDHESGGRAIDIHTHVVPRELPGFPSAGPAAAVWPSVVARGCCARHVMMGDKFFRALDSRSWDVAARERDMDVGSVGRQVLSPMPELLSYWIGLPDAAVLLRYLNEQMAEMVAASPTRFFGLGAVPLQHVGQAIEELRFIMEDLQLPGIEIGTHVNGRVIGSHEFEPFWDAVEAFGAAVFVHPLRPVGADRLVGPDSLKQVLAYPSETGLALASLMTSGILDRHPALRIAASHGGGSFAALLPRLQHAWTTLPKIRECMATAPAELAKRIYVDSLVYDSDTLKGLIRIFGGQRIVMGSDYPYAIQEQDPVGAVDRLALASSTAELILWQNATRWLNRPSQ